jgi:hypothetical protein
MVTAVPPTDLVKGKGLDLPRILCGVRWSTSHGTVCGVTPHGFRVTTPHGNREPKKTNVTYLRHAVGLRSRESRRSRPLPSSRPTINATMRDQHPDFANLHLFMAVDFATANATNGGTAPKPYPTAVVALIGYGTWNTDFTGKRGRLW